MVYPDGIDRHNLAWEFEPQDHKYSSNKIEQSPSITQTIQFIDYWRQVQSQCSLIKIGNKIYDDRDPSQHQTCEITDVQSELLDYCFIPRRNEDLRENFDSGDILELVDSNFLVIIEDRCLSLIEPAKDFDYYRKTFGTNSSEPQKLNVLYPKQRGESVDLIGSSGK